MFSVERSHFHSNKEYLIIFVIQGNARDDDSISFTICSSQLCFCLTLTIARIVIDMDEVNLTSKLLTILAFKKRSLADFLILSHLPYYTLNLYPATISHAVVSDWICAGTPHPARVLRFSCCAQNLGKHIKGLPFTFYPGVVHSFIGLCSRSFLLQSQMNFKNPINENDHAAWDHIYRMNHLRLATRITFTVLEIGKKCFKWKWKVSKEMYFGHVVFFLLSRGAKKIWKSPSFFKIV